MASLKQKSNDKQILRVLASAIEEAPKHHTPSYKNLAEVLNSKGLKTNWHNEWTPKRLFRFLQRKGFSGVWGFRNSLRQYRKLSAFL